MQQKGFELVQNARKTSYTVSHCNLWPAAVSAGLPSGMPWGQCSCRLTFYGRNDESLRVATSRCLHHHFDESVLDLDQGRLSLSNVVFAILSHAGQHRQDSPICWSINVCVHTFIGYTPSWT